MDNWRKTDDGEIKMDLISDVLTRKPLPNWVPKPAQIYLAHTEAGLPIRALARMSGCHASTILRQIRKIETRRDDPLVDAALRALGAHHFDTSNDGTAVGTTNGSVSLCKEPNTMSFTAKITADEFARKRFVASLLQLGGQKREVAAGTRHEF